MFEEETKWRGTVRHVCEKRFHLDRKILLEISKIYSNLLASTEKPFMHW